jgi:hypothetical protein
VRRALQHIEFSHGGIDIQHAPMLGYNKIGLPFCGGDAILSINYNAYGNSSWAIAPGANDRPDHRQRD